MDGGAETCRLSSALTAGEAGETIVESAALGLSGIAAMTIAFGVGQTFGPIAVGAVTDALGSLSYALNVSAALLALGAMLAAFQPKLKS